jgi:hypothetical protein
MPVNFSVFDVPCKAEGDLSTKQYYAVELSGADRQVDVCDNAGDTVFGVLQDKPAAVGRACAVRVLGITKWVSDGNAGAIVVGDVLGTNAAGKAVKKTANNDKIAGLALSASTADGTVIDVFLTPGVYLGA